MLGRGQPFFGFGPQEALEEGQDAWERSAADRGRGQRISVEPAMDGRQGIVGPWTARSVRGVAYTPKSKSAT